MNKILVSGIAAAGIAGGSLGIAALTPFGVAGAQDTSSTTAAATASPAATPDNHKSPFADVLKSLVDDNTISQAQSDAIATRLEAARPQGEHGRRGPGGGPQIDEAATFLGTTAAELRTQLDGGKTLAQIAGDKTDALIADLVAKANARIDAAVTSGKLDQTKADQLKTDTAKRVTDMVNGVKPAGGPRGDRDGDHGRPPAGAPAPSTSTTPAG